MLKVGLSAAVAINTDTVGRARKANRDIYSKMSIVQVILMHISSG